MSPGHCMFIVRHVKLVQRTYKHKIEVKNQTRVCLNKESVWKAVSLQFSIDGGCDWKVYRLDYKLT